MEILNELSAICPLTEAKSLMFCLQPTELAHEIPELCDSLGLQICLDKGMALICTLTHNEIDDPPCSFHLVDERLCSVFCRQVKSLSPVIPHTVDQS